MNICAKPAFFIPVLLGWMGNGSLSFAQTAANSSSEEEDTILSGAKIYPSPEAEPIIDGAIHIRNGKIVYRSNLK